MGSFAKPLKLIIAGLWLSLLGGALLSWWQTQIPLGEIPRLLEDLLSEFGIAKAALIYVLFYAVRPLILLPATLLTMASGLIFGPWLGTLFTLIGENASANLAFVLARWFGRQSVVKHVDQKLRDWDLKLQRNGLMSVLIMRLTMFPFDAVNYGCGLTAIRQRDFALGTLIGILPSMTGFVLLGGTVAAGVEHRQLIIALSVLFLGIGFTTAQLLRRHENQVIRAEKKALAVNQH